jgi:hypothetical protein
VGRVLEKDLFHSMDELRREGGGGLRGGLREGEKKKFGEGERDAKREDFFFSCARKENACILLGLGQVTRCLVYGFAQFRAGLSNLQIHEQ